MISPAELLSNEPFYFKFPRTLEINDGAVTYCADDFAEIVARWVRFFKTDESYDQGVIVNFEHWSVDVLAIYLALILSGTPYYALNSQTLRENNLKALYDQGITEIIYLPRPYHQYDQDLLEIYWEIGFNTEHLECLDIDGKYSALEWNIEPDRKNFYCFTSGTTGEPKLIGHTNRAVWTSAVNAANLYYSMHDRVLLTSLPNHIGVMTMAVLGPVLAGSHIVLANISDPDVIAKYNYGNKTLLFYYQLMNPILDAVDFSKYKLVITGGEAIRQHYLDLVFKRGVRQVASVYGLTEAMPPVATKWFDRPTLDYDLGEFTAGIEYRVVHGVLELRGANSYTWPDWLRTGDLVEEIDGKVYYKTREVMSVRRGGELINVDRLKEHCELQGLDHFMLRVVEPDRIEAHGELEAQVELITDRSIDLTALNKTIVQALGENYKITLHRQAPIERNDIYKATRL